MEDIRPYRIEEEKRSEPRIVTTHEDDRRTFEWDAPSDDEVPFHIPRD
jgi:hypothetical protein